MKRFPCRAALQVYRFATPSTKWLILSRVKHSLCLAALFFLLFVSPVRADEARYLELTDAPTIAVDWHKATIQSVILGGDRILVFNHGEKGRHYLLIVKQDETGSRTVTWPGSVRCPGTTCPMLTTTAGKTDYVTFFFNGVNYDLLGVAQNY